MFVQQFIKTYLKENPKVTQVDIASLTGLTKAAINNYVKGIREPLPQDGYRILKKLGASKEIITAYIVKEFSDKNATESISVDRLMLNDDPIRTELTKLKSLFEDGLIDEEEYKTKKKTILGI